MTNCSHDITNAVAEGFNAKIATLQERACGRRSPERFTIAVHFRCGGLGGLTGVFDEPNSARCLSYTPGPCLCRPFHPQYRPSR